MHKPGLLHPRRSFTASTTVLGLSACLALSACGGGSHPARDAASKASAARPSTSANGAQSTATAPASEGQASVVLLPSGPAAARAVASVAGEPISAAEVRHWMALKSRNAPVPDPPQYSRCIANLKQTALKSPGSPAQSDLQLKQSCQGSYEEQIAAALGAAIHNRWLAGEAREEGISVGEREVQKELELSKRSFKAEAEFAAYLRHAGQTLTEFKSEIKLGKLANGIFQKINERAEAASRASASTAAAGYYAAHKAQFSVPSGRRVLIVRTATEASALRAKQQLRSGKSFSALAKELSAIGQPVTAKNGEVADLKPHLFQEKVLDDAIFNAKLNRLYGPVKITAAHRTIAPETNSGFFIFEVKAIVPGRQIPLSKVKEELTSQLSKHRREQSVAAQIKAFRAKWKARTDCRPGYVLVRSCRQFKVGQKSAVPLEDPYTL